MRIPFPAIPAEQTEELIRVYDLSSPLPVLRTFQPAQVRLAAGSAWSHDTVVRNYSDTDLEAVTELPYVVGRDAIREMIPKPTTDDAVFVSTVRHI